jgi:1-aminocyclopropane-1-carboxylate deaminase/D-cysteine desulfhydrase-like pyridoxal-dependent ACC family enzyme
MNQAIETLHAIACQNFGFYPTPLEELGRLRSALGQHAPRLFIKRDDYTGFALGGNKVRKLEYELAPERVRDVDVLITSGGFGSNHARVTAAAAARLGKRCILVLNGTPPDPPRGNAFLQQLFGAEIVNVPDRAARTSKTLEIAADLKQQGTTALVVPLGASTAQGALGYARAAIELADQLVTTQLDPGHLYIIVSASSAGTLAGLLVGLQLTALRDTRLVGVSPDDPAGEIRAAALDIAQGTASILAARLELDNNQPTVTDAYVGGGYGVPSAESKEAIELFARSEGVVLDPVYSAKAAACLIDWVRRREFSEIDNVLFWHTGGWPTLLA